MRLRLASLALLLAATSVAHADSLLLTLGNATRTGSGGSTLTFSGTASAPTANSGTEYLNGDSYGVTAGAMLDDSPYLNAFAFTLDPGQSFTGDLFTLTLPANAVAGSVYTGNFTIIGGSDANAQDKLGSATFSAAIPAVAAVTPEPSTLVLFGSATLGFAFLTLRSRFLLSSTNITA